MNNDLISRAALLEKKTRTTEYDETGCGVHAFVVREEDVFDAPAVDAEPVRRGEWIVLARFSNREIVTECPYCREEYTYKFGKLELINRSYAKYNYCPNCGARLDITKAGE